MACKRKCGIYHFPPCRGYIIATPSLPGYILHCTAHHHGHPPPSPGGDANNPKVMTLSGTGDLTLHKGGLSVQGQLTPGSTRDGAWNAEPPPRAVQVLGGSLGVLGGGAEIFSSRANTPALAISVGLDDALDAKSGGEGAEDPLGRRRKHEFSFSGAALSVNVREPSSAEEVLPVRDRFRLLELSVGGKRKDEEGREGGFEEDADVLMSVRGDGRVLMRGGGGVVVGEGSLDVSQGNANVKVRI